MNQREQRLLAVFLTVCVAVVSWLGYTRIEEEKSRMLAEAEKLTSNTERDQNFLDAYEAELTGAKTWMGERLGEPVSPQEADIRLLNAVQDSARNASLTLNTPKFLAAQERGRLRLARYSASVTGSETVIYPWLDEFHDPDKLRCISGLTIKPDKDDDTVVTCEVEFAQWYVPETAQEQL